MKYLFYILFSLAGIAIGLVIGSGLFSGYEMIIGIFILLPMILIFCLLGWKSKVKRDMYGNEKENHKQDRFSKWY